MDKKFTIGEYAKKEVTPEQFIEDRISRIKYWRAEEIKLVNRFTKNRNKILDAVHRYADEIKEAQEALEAIKKEKV